jgi:hypothetical protein
MLNQFETTLDIGGGVNFTGRVDYSLSPTGQPENVRFSVGGGFCGYAGQTFVLLLPADGAKIVELEAAINSQCADQLAQRVAKHAEASRPPQPGETVAAPPEAPATEHKPSKSAKGAGGTVK